MGIKFLLKLIIVRYNFFVNIYLFIYLFIYFVILLLRSHFERQKRKYFLNFKDQSKVLSSLFPNELVK